MILILALVLACWSREGARWLGAFFLRPWLLTLLMLPATAGYMTLLGIGWRGNSTAWAYAGPGFGCMAYIPLALFLAFLNDNGGNEDA